MTLEERIHKEIGYRKHPMEEWSLEKDPDAVRDFKAFLDKSKYKVVVALCIYNEEQFIYETLDDCRKIADLDGIHILDGGWEHGGTSPVSTDKTHAEITRWIVDNDNEITVTVERNPDNKLWASEGIKRNYQLKAIEKQWGDAYVVIHDGDENIEFNCGRKNIWLKEVLATVWPFTILCKSFSFNGVNDAVGVRVIPTGQGVHYHTDRPMIVHDHKCDIMCDYNFDKTVFIKQNATKSLPLIIFVNKWNTRILDRVKDKDKYAEYVFEPRKPKDCEYKP
jgi:glycosyltransferase involved in cell wall biosynthesis